MYNYHKAVKNDVLDAIRQEWTPEDLARILYTDRDNLEMDLNDALWIDDAVTGNMTGSYTCNRAEARGYILDNLDLLEETVDDGLMDAGEVLKALADQEFEYLDVCIRCDLLPAAIIAALNDLEEDPEIEAEIDKLRAAEEAAG